MSAAQIQDRRINAGTSAKATTAQFNGQFSQTIKNIFSHLPLVAMQIILVLFVQVFHISIYEISATNLIKWR